MKETPKMPQIVRTASATTPEQIRAEAHARGIDKGWFDSALSVGVGEPLPLNAETFVNCGARQAAEIYGPGTDEFWGFVHGYTEGVERHQADQWQDSTARQYPENRREDDIEAYARGLSDGWSAANYAAAYVSDHSQPQGETLEREAVRRARECYAGGGWDWQQCCEYARGFGDGVQRYQADRWEDGTPRHADDDAEN